MALKRLMVDTSAYSALTRGHAEIGWAVQTADEVYVSPVLLGELHSGFRGGDRQSSNEAALRRFLATPGVMVAQIGAETAIFYSEICSYLRETGAQIPTNDMWIAAGAMEHGLRVITTDAHFRRVRQVMVDCYPVAETSSPNFLASAFR